MDEGFDLRITSYVNVLVLCICHWFFLDERAFREQTTEG